MPEAEPTQTDRLTVFLKPVLETKVRMLGTDSEYALLWPKCPLALAFGVV